MDDVEQISRLVDCIYESMSIYYGLIIHDDCEDALAPLAHSLMKREYPIVLYDKMPDIVTSHDHMLLYRMYIINVETLPIFIHTWGSFINNINFVMTIGAKSLHNYKIFARMFSKENTVVVNL